MITEATDSGANTPLDRPYKKGLADLKKMFSDYQFMSETNRTQGLIDYDYVDGKQLTPSEREVLAQRGQPDIVVNRTRVAINGILGVIVQSKTDPKCWPRNQQDGDGSDVATDLIRYAIEESRFHKEKTHCARDYLVGGTTAVIVGVDDDMRPTITQIRWEEFFIDPRSRRIDGADAMYMGIAKWMYLTDVASLYPNSKDDMDNIVEGGGVSLGVGDESFQDRPINMGWIDYRARRIMVVEIYYKDVGGWCKAVFFFAGILEQGLSPFQDNTGVPTNPIKSTSCYMDRENMRYGLVRDMRSLQDEINKRRSKLLHLANNSQVEAVDPSAVEVDPDTARLEAARPDGVIPFGWRRVQTSDMAQGQALLLSEAKAEMERLGPNPAVLGRQGADTSGRALLARQQAGLVEIAVILDQLEDWELRVYKAIWERVKQFWTAPMVIRVTDDYEAPSFIGINEPIPNPNAGQPMVDDRTGTPAVDPTTGAPIVAPDTLGYKNSVAEMDIDIIIDTAPATATIMQEMFKDLMDLVGSNPLYASQVPFTTFLELMPGLPHKRRIMKQLKAFGEQQQQQQQAEKAQEQQLMMAQVMAKVKDMLSKAGLNQALAVKAVGDTKATAVRAETQAGKALSDATVAHRTSDIAHREANTHRYEVLAEAAAQAAEADAAGNEATTE